MHFDMHMVTTCYFIGDEFLREGFSIEETGITFSLHQGKDHFMYPEATIW